MLDQTEPIVYKLREKYAAYEKSGKHFPQLAKESGVSEVTAKRIINGVTQKPSISDVIALWKAMGGTSTELFDDTVKVDVVAESPQVVVPQIDEKLYTQIIDIYKEQLKEKDKRITSLIKVVTILIISLALVCIAAVIAADIIAVIE